VPVAAGVAACEQVAGAVGGAERFADEGEDPVPTDRGEGGTRRDRPQPVNLDGTAAPGLAAIARREEHDPVFAFPPFFGPRPSLVGVAEVDSVEGGGVTRRGDVAPPAPSVLGPVEPFVGAGPAALAADEFGPGVAVEESREFARFGAFLPRGGVGGVFKRGGAGVGTAAARECSEGDCDDYPDRRETMAPEHSGKVLAASTHLLNRLIRF
jgi:hypothetical protein